MIYFIQRPDGGPIKIGTTIRLSQRLKQLAAETDSELRVLAVVDGSFEVERSLHQRFAHLRAVGEWFEPGDDLSGFIVADGQEWDGSDEAPKPDQKSIAFRASAEYADWVDALASHNRSTVAGLLDQALVKFAREIGFTASAPER